MLTSRVEYLQIGWCEGLGDPEGLTYITGTVSTASSCVFQAQIVHLSVSLFLSLLPASKIQREGRVPRKNLLEHSMPISFFKLNEGVGFG